MPVSVGDTAPIFTLPGAPGKTVEVDAAKAGGPVVVLFFPLAFSGVCTEEFCTIRDDWSAWTGMGASVYGVSIDSPFANAKFREVENLPFPLLSDFNKTVAAEWGALHEDLMGLKGVTKRAAFVVGGDGTVVYAWISDDPGVQVDFNAIKQAVEQAAGATAN